MWSLPLSDRYSLFVVFFVGCFAFRWRVCSLKWNRQPDGRDFCFSILWRFAVYYVCCLEDAFLATVSLRASELSSRRRTLLMALQVQGDFIQMKQMKPWAVVYIFHFCVFVVGSCFFVFFSLLHLLFLSFWNISYLLLAFKVPPKGDTRELQW